MFNLPVNQFRTGHTYFSVILCVFIVLLGAVRGSAQDLGAIAREEQARKQGQPAHATHIYTNDDLARTQILVPEDAAAIDADLKKPEPVRAENDLQTEKQKTSSTVAERSVNFETATPTISLGEVARQFREQKLARQKEFVTETQSVVATHHVYKTEDLSREKILTPEDHVVYQAGLKKIIPETVGTLPTIAMPETSAVVPTQTSSYESQSSATSLGEIARVVFQEREKQIAKRIEAQKPSRFPFTWTTAFASMAPEKFSGNVPTSNLRVAHKIVARKITQARKTRHHLIKVKTSRPDATSETITVRSGDSLWKLARQHLGGGVQWKMLLAANPWITNPNFLKVGTKISI